MMHGQKNIKLFSTSFLNCTPLNFSLSWLWDSLKKI